jgi:hypothetical protein
LALASISSSSGDTPSGSSHLDQPLLQALPRLLLYAHEELAVAMAHQEGCLHATSQPEEY